GRNARRRLEHTTGQRRFGPSGGIRKCGRGSGRRGGSRHRGRAEDCRDGRPSRRPCRAASSGRATLGAAATAGELEQAEAHVSRVPVLAAGTLAVLAAPVVLVALAIAGAAPTEPTATCQAVGVADGQADTS